LVDPGWRETGPVTARDLGLRWFAVPARDDLRRGAVVPAVGPVLPGCRELLAERGVTVDHVTVYCWV
jgi:hypothetical protein